MNHSELESISQAYEDNWSSQNSGARFIEDFLGSTGIEAASAPALRSEIVQIDIERCWMHWAKQLSDTWNSTPCQEILQQFLNIPRLENYAKLLPGGICDSVFWHDIAQAEMSARTEWGDAIGPLHYEHHWQLSISAREHRPAIFARCIRRDATTNNRTITFPILGRSILGRQRSTQPDDEPLMQGPDGNRIAIAGRSEDRVSRTHVQIQVLHPRFVAVLNNSKINAVGLPFPDADLQPGGSTVVKVPFTLQFPGRTMQFTSA